MAKLLDIDPRTQCALSTARYLQSILGDLAKLAQGAQLETTEAMLLAAKIEAAHAVRVLSGGLPKPAIIDYSRSASNASATRPPGDETA
ncbi:MAG: hypothetical protein ABWZ40_04995 [Caulobacterales bacterium]